MQSNVLNDLAKAKRRRTEKTKPLHPMILQHQHSLRRSNILLRKRVIHCVSCSLWLWQVTSGRVKLKLRGIQQWACSRCPSNSECLEYFFSSTPTTLQQQETSQASPKSCKRLMGLSFSGKQSSYQTQRNNMKLTSSGSSSNR